MFADHSRKAAVFSSAVLAVSTLGIFFGLQNYGPESVVRRFHRAATNGDLQTIRTITNEPTQNFAVVQLVQEIQSLASQGYAYEFQRVQNVPRLRVTVVYVTYRPPRPGPVLTRPWIVGKRDQLWRVEAEATLDPMGFLGQLQGR